MKPSAVAVAAMAIVSTGCGQTTTSTPWPEVTPDEWRAAAKQDIDGIHDILRDNAPFMVVNRDSADMRRWLETGRKEASNDLSKVTDVWSYHYVLDRYVGGFRDGHLGVGTTKTLNGPMTNSPGFKMAWRNGNYEVGWVQAGMEATMPPIGAALVSCDGKPAETLAQERLDRLFGNLRLEATRSESAALLLEDFSQYPITRPKTCSFRVAGRVKNWTLTWSVPTGEVVRESIRATSAPRAKFGVDRWGENAWWIGAPTMTDDENWKAIYAAVETNLGAIRSADAVVIDLRGNGGGNSAFGDKLARKLFGDPIVDANAVAWGDLVFKAGPLSRKWAADALTRALDKDDRDWLAEMKPASEQLDAAPLGSMVLVKADPPPKPTLSSTNPVRGKVIVLVDYACFSACLDTLDVFTRLPGVKLAGVETGADTIFMDGMRTPLPSGKATLTFGIKAWVQRERGSNVSFKPDPSLRYTGSLADEAALTRWLADALGVKGT